MRNLTKKQLIYMSFYYFWIIFLIACIFHDLYFESITGFTFGYVFALFYFTTRAHEATRELEDYNE